MTPFCPALQHTPAAAQGAGGHVLTGVSCSFHQSQQTYEYLCRYKGCDRSAEEWEPRTRERMGPLLSLPSNTSCHLYSCVLRPYIYITKYTVFTDNKKLRKGRKRKIKKVIVQTSALTPFFLNLQENTKAYLAAKCFITCPAPGAPSHYQNRPSNSIP